MPNPENVIGKGKLFSKTNQPANRGRKKSAYKELLGIIEQGGGTPLSYEVVILVIMDMVYTPT